MTDDKTGGSAFPVQIREDDRLDWCSEGMTLRDWFAGQALAGMLVEGMTHREMIAGRAYAYAMLAERGK